MKNARTSSVLSQLDLNLLHVFHIVYRERSVRKAASILSISQSAVSHAIGRLRLQLGVPLFEQHGRGLVPTAMADRLAPAVDAALNHIEDVLAGTQKFDAKRDVARLAVAMPGQIEPLLLPHLVHQVTTETPGVAIVSVRLDRAQMKKDLESGFIDAALDAATPIDPDLSNEILFEDTLCVVAANDMGPLDRDAYLAARHIAVSSRRRGPSLVDLMLIQAGLRRDVVIRCQRYEAACRIAASSDLLLTMSLRTAQTLDRAIATHIIPLNVVLPPHKVHLYWHRRRDGDPAVLWMRTLLRNISAKL